MKKWLLLLSLIYSSVAFAGQHVVGNLDVTGNIGVGSINPGKAIDVQGTVRASFFSGDGSALTNLPSSISGLTTNVLPKATAATTIGNSQLFDNGTNIGIGSLVPGTFLDIFGTVRILNGGNLTLPGNVGVGTTNIVAGLTVMSGNVGIGTWGPRSTMEVNGDISLSKTIATRTIKVENPTSAGSPNGLGGSLTIQAGTALNNGSGDNDINGGSLTLNAGDADNSGGSGAGGTVTIAAGSSRGRASGNVVINPGVVLGSVGAGNVGNITLANVRGNVGIGTTLSKNKLDVASNVTIGTTYAGYFTGPANGLGIQGNLGVGTYGPVAEFELAGDMKFSKVTGTRTISAATQTTSDITGTNIAITAGLPRSGSTLADGGALTLTGGTAGGGGSTGKGGDININAGGSSGTGINSAAGNVLLNGGANAAGSGFIGNVLLASARGNVGIATLTPGTTLDVVGTLRVNLAGSASVPSLVIGNANNTGLWNPAVSTLAVSTGGTERFRIDNAGNIGVGSSVPGQNLDVQGTVRSLGFISGSNCFYYCNGGVDVGVLSRGSGCLCPGGSCVATNICSN